MPFNEETISIALRGLLPEGESSNRVYRFSLDGQRLILKENPDPAQPPSPFWWAIQELFEVDAQARRQDLFRLYAFLRENPHIPPAEPLLISEKYRFQLFREATGSRWEPDEFPGHPETARQLGRYLGWLHSHSLPGWGSPLFGGREGCFAKAMAACMAEMISLYWHGDIRLKQALEELEPPEPESFYPIMPDISGNQFLYGEGFRKIAAVVDLDAYVSGPRELELTIVELCLTHGEDFRKGYEAYRPLPELSRCRSFYRFFSYLCDPWAGTDWEEFLNRPILF